jgi:MOSC domain-containing protein YiiM
MKSQSQIFSRYVKDLPAGKLDWIGVRPAHKQDMLETQQVMAIKDFGLEGDHRCNKTPGSARQVTLISAEYIQMIKHFSGNHDIHPALLRRNLVVSGINLTAMRYQTFSIGDVLFEATALCHPCSRMEKAIGKGGLAAMLGHGGLCAKIIRGGTITIGNAVEVIVKQDDLFS